MCAFVHACSTMIVCVCVCVFVCVCVGEYVQVYMCVSVTQCVCFCLLRFYQYIYNPFPILELNKQTLPEYSKALTIMLSVNSTKEGLFPSFYTMGMGRRGHLAPLYQGSSYNCRVMPKYKPAHTVRSSNSAISKGL